MTSSDQPVSRPVFGGPGIKSGHFLFVATIFLSATLVFLVQPMVAKLVLPLLGGTPAVWNTSMAFFQLALLAGYLYAHLLQRLSSVRTQAFVHLGVLAAAAIVLPLNISGALGDPDTSAPILWLLGVLALSIGAPFAALSATAPLVQAWRARLKDPDDHTEPYALYAASNLGSLLALIAYPLIVEPTLTLQAQRISWSLGYGVFFVTLGALAFLAIRGRGHIIEKPAEPAEPIRWRERLIWIGLAAAPSSLMLGTTTYLTTDVASAPFLWVAPLALYLLTFVIAFQTRPLISRQMALVLGAAAVAACAYVLPFHTNDIFLQLLVHLTAFFFTALICHQTLVARRPPASQLTEFYLFMSIGGVVGGAFNAFLAPVIFNVIFEYPLVLVLAVFARPFGPLELPLRSWVLFGAGVIAAVAAFILMSVADYWPGVSQISALVGKMTLVKATLAITLVAAFLLRRHVLAFPGLLVMLLVSGSLIGDQVEVRQTWRSFFGVARQSVVNLEAYGGDVMMLAHGTTLHGAQAPVGPYGCKPMVYYAEETPIGQVFITSRAVKPALNFGAVGLGTGTVATFVRETDRMTFFEIDPLMVEIATNPAYFSYIGECAKGPIDFVMGDARLTLSQESNDKYDVLLIDAFSSDAVPAHLLTVEALKMYLTKIKPDGVVVLHLSNRNLNLLQPAQASALAAGAATLFRKHTADPNLPFLWESSEDVVIMARNPQALAAYASDPRWEPSQAVVRPWTDDYTNLVGALIARAMERWSQ
jgi:predicted O-methyltransferase YrrM